MAAQAANPDLDAPALRGAPTSWGRSRRELLRSMAQKILVIPAAHERIIFRCASRALTRSELVRRRKWQGFFVPAWAGGASQGGERKRTNL